MGQSEESVKIEIPLSKFMEMDKALQAYPLLKEIKEKQDKTVAELQNSLAIEKKTNELNEREIDLLKRINEVDKREIESQKRTIQDFKDISDRAIKLAEVSKPKSNWQLYGLAAIVGYVINELIHR
jgi:hypothetical protein